MIGWLIGGLFNFIMGLVATVIQIVVWPINALITATMPDISQSITDVGTGFQNLLNTVPWALSIVPRPLLITLGVIFGLRLAISTLKISTHTLLKVWNVLQKIKFW